MNTFFVDNITPERKARNTLAENIGKLSTRDQQFAASLLAAFDSARGASPKQMEWILRLAEKSVAPPPPPVPVADVGGDFDAMTALFDGAREKGLKWPKIRLSLLDGTRVDLGVAGPEARFPGSINVKVAGEWKGRILKDGNLQQPRGALPFEVVDLLRKFARDPAGVGKAIGHKFGYCCFCAAELTDARSVEAGYGPICASRWGLPWGERAVA